MLQPNCQPKMSTVKLLNPDHQALQATLAPLGVRAVERAMSDVYTGTGWALPADCSQPANKTAVS